MHITELRSITGSERNIQKSTGRNDSSRGKNLVTLYWHKSKDLKEKFEKTKLNSKSFQSI